MRPRSLTFVGRTAIPPPQATVAGSGPTSSSISHDETALDGELKVLLGKNGALEAKQQPRTDPKRKVATAEEAVW
jgi:hypothetical protein